MSDTKQQNTKTKPVNVKIGALWQKDGPKGTYFSGEITGKSGQPTKIVAFSNSYKESPNHPDFIVYLSSNQEPSKKSSPIEKSVAKKSEPTPEPEF